MLVLFMIRHNFSQLNSKKVQCIHKNIWNNVDLANVFLPQKCDGMEEQD